MNVPEPERAVGGSGAPASRVHIFAYASDAPGKGDTQSCNYLFWKLSYVLRNTRVSGLVALTAT